MEIRIDDPTAVALMTAIRSGDVDALRRRLIENPALATARIVNDRGGRRSLLHVVADWPGHFHNAAATANALIDAGADANATMPHPTRKEAAETPLHWAASSDDVELLDALLDRGADIEAPGAIFTGGTPMSDAVVFAQWNAARRLRERGARMTIWQAAALGDLQRVEEFFARETPSPMDITNAFWHACRGGQRQTAEYLLARGADPNWIGYDGKTPLDAALDSGAADLIARLRSNGASTIR